MNFKTTRRAALFALLAAPLFLGSCGTKTKTTSSDGSKVTAKSEASSDSPTTEASVASEMAAPSGSESAPTDGVKLADGQAPAERTIVIDGETMTPTALTIAVGENVTFKTDGGTHSVIVGSLDGATVVKGLIETFVFSKPGTYPAKDDLTAATAIITVQ